MIAEFKVDAGPPIIIERYVDRLLAVEKSVVT
jgi:hypothetical protein